MSWPNSQLIALSDEELAEARRVGEERNAHKEKRKVQSRKSSSKLSDAEAHVVGVMGEMAVAKHFGGSIDKNRYKGGDTHDVKLPCGHFVSVRTRDGDRNRHPDRVILSNSRRKGHSNTVCCIKRGMLVEVVGLWSPGDTIHLHDFGYGPRETVLFSEIRDLDTVTKHVEECLDGKN